MKTIKGIKKVWKRRNIFFLLFVPILLSSCVSTYQLTVEALSPAPITFPTDIRNLLIVNNSVQQPNNVGITRTFDGKAVTTDYELSFDSISWFAIESMAAYIESSLFFDDVSFYNKPVRTDENWLSLIPLSESFKKDVFEREGFDGIISIDKVLFNGEQDVKPNMQNYISYYIDNTTKAEVFCSIYLYDQEEALKSFSITGNVSYKNSEYGDSLSLFKLLPESLIAELASKMGEKLAAYVTPSWIQKDRIIFTNQNARMQEAFRFFKNQRWAEAEMIWLDEYAKKTKPVDKAKLANNMAVLNEIQDKLEIALRWAITAQQFFNESGLTETSTEKMHIDSYVEDLTKRMEDNRQLDIQWGTEE